jgi:hypothetical protein
MIWQPKAGMVVLINYKDKSMYWQGYHAIVCAAGIGPGPKNVLIKIPVCETWHFEIVPRGNLNKDITLQKKR